MNKISSKANNKTTLFNWFAVFIWAGVIFALSSIPQIQVSQLFFWDFIAKKTAHIAEYSIFYILLFRATGRKFALSYLLLAIYAVSDELHQKVVPGRTSTPLDIGFDLTGASIASYIIWKLGQIRENRQKKSPKN